MIVKECFRREEEQRCYLRFSKKKGIYDGEDGVNGKCTDRFITLIVLELLFLFYKLIEGKEVIVLTPQKDQKVASSALYLVSSFV